MHDWERRSWVESVTCQFYWHLGCWHAPAWFYLLLGGLCLLTAGVLCWRICGWLLLLAAAPVMVQETRRKHGAELSLLGWWHYLQYCLLEAAAVVLIVAGARRGWRNLEFAVGVLGAVLVLAWAAFRAVANRFNR